MPRPRKCRRICMLPRCSEFRPDAMVDHGRIAMTLDEFEAIRLMDWEGLTQEECAGQMEVARTTVQAIYSSARKKIASCLVNGYSLAIGGGEYRLCDNDDSMPRHNCRRRRCIRHSAGEDKGDGSEDCCHV